jgi:pyridoxal phosphate enzyme (YggS family)
MALPTVDEIRQNLKRVEAGIQQACARAGRERREVQLIAVSKTFPVQCVVAAIQAGIGVFGENRVQEAVAKFAGGILFIRSVQLENRQQSWSENKEEQLVIGSRPSNPTDRPGSSPVRLHLIGPLQSNKAKLAAGLFDMIQTVDRLEIAQKLDHQCDLLNRLLPVLVQVNLGNEETKSGVEPARALELVKQASRMKHLRVRGLMSIPPFRDVAEDSRADFRALRELAKEIARVGVENVSMNELSMGMSHDFEVAIEEGATMVRVGTGIFGRRSYGEEASSP